MLQKYNIYIKIISLTVIYGAIYFVEMFLYEISVKEDSVVIGIAYDILQSWLIVLVGFFFFQTFKYFRLWDRYYKKKFFENESFFKYIGVPLYQIFLINSFLRYANSRVYLKGRKRDYIKIYHEETKQSETSHLFVLILTLIIQGLYLYQGERRHFIYMTGCNILFNLYPMLLQRKNRFYLESKFPQIVG